jgi:hypothetical protein
LFRWRQGWASQNRPNKQGKSEHGAEALFMDNANFDGEYVPQHLAEKFRK